MVGEQLELWTMGVECLWGPFSSLGFEVLLNEFIHRQPDRPIYSPCVRREKWIGRRIFREPIVKPEADEALLFGKSAGHSQDKIVKQIGRGLARIETFISGNACCREPDALIKGSMSLGNEVALVPCHPARAPPPTGTKIAAESLCPLRLKALHSNREPIS